ncbi:hypothetical protein [Burkholderia ambifaria]|uniref:hypothetical protein n=2 Tax=Burkholderia ambifaria TaxID=152480 RepID=UPI0015895783|nr:hypothetical protein [Burkholderia ambifaria]
MPSPAMVYSPEQHGTVTKFENSKAYPQFRDEMTKTLDRLVAFAEQHASHDAQEVQGRVDTFKERLFNLEHNYYSDSRVAFYVEGKRAFDQLHGLLQNDDIRLDLRISAVRNVAGELEVCGPGMIPKLITEVGRLCHTNGGLLAASWQRKHDIIEQLITDFVREHREYSRGNEVHEVVAFKNYGADRLGISVPSAPDPFAPQDVAPEQLEACMTAVEDYMSPSRLALVMADDYLQAYLDRLSDETKIAPDQLTRGVAYDNAIVETSNRIVRELAPTYGADTVKECSASILAFDEAGADGNEVVRVPTDPTPLARDILRAQHEAGLIGPDYQDGNLVLGWSERGSGVKVEIRHNDETLVWATMGGQVEPLTVAHLARFPKPELEKLQVDQPKLVAALGRAVIECEPAEALMKLPLHWLPPEHCGRVLSRLSDEQASDYLQAFGRALTPEQQRAFATAVIEQRRLPLFDHVSSWGVGSPTVQSAMARWLGEALLTGNAGAVEAFGTLLAQVASRLTPGQIADLLAAKDDRGTPGWTQALENGHAGAVKVFGTLLAQVAPRLTPEQIADLLAAKDDAGTPCWTQLDSDDAGVVDAFGTLLAQAASWLTPEQIADLLAAKDNAGTPCLAEALDSDDAGAVEAFGTLLAQVAPRLTPEQIAGLLAAKDDDGVPGLFWALKDRDGRATVIEAYGKVLADPALRLSPEQIEGLLAAKDDNGTAGLLRMFLKDANGAATITAYGKVLADPALRLSPEQIERLLAAKDGDGTPGLFLAFKLGYASIPVIKAYGKVLADPALRLSPEQIERLLATKHDDGTPRPFAVLCGGSDDDEIEAYNEVLAWLAPRLSR